MVFLRQMGDLNLTVKYQRQKPYGLMNRIYPHKAAASPKQLWTKLPVIIIDSPAG